MCKILIVCLLSFVWVAAKSQTYYTYRVDIHCVGEWVSVNKEYVIKRDGAELDFTTPRIGGNDGWAFKIIDSTKNGTYILQYHWMKTFDSLQIIGSTIRLFNRTDDQIIYSK